MGKTIFVLLDACRWDVGTSNAGYLEHLIDSGKGAKYKVRGELPSMSRPMYETLLTGLPSWEHGIVNNEVVRLSRCENIFGMCGKRGLVTAAAAYYWMSELYNSAPFDRLTQRYQLDSGGGIAHGIFYWEDQYPDTHVFADGEFLRAAYHPDFLLYHSMNVDMWGHLKGGDSREYAAAVAKVMEHLAQLVPLWLRDGYRVIIAGDHGMNALGMHGGPTEEQRTVPLYLFGVHCKSGRFEDQPISQRNIAPLLCECLGIPPSDGMITTGDILK